MAMRSSRIGQAKAIQDLRKESVGAAVVAAVDSNKER